MPPTTKPKRSTRAPRAKSIPTTPPSAVAVAPVDPVRLAKLPPSARATDGPDAITDDYVEDALGRLAERVETEKAAGADFEGDPVGTTLPCLTDYLFALAQALPYSAQCEQFSAYLETINRDALVNWVGVALGADEGGLLTGAIEATADELCDLDCEMLALVRDLFRTEPSGERMDRRELDPGLALLDHRARGGALSARIDALEVHRFEIRNRIRDRLYRLEDLAGRLEASGKRAVRVSGSEPTISVEEARLRIMGKEEPHRSRAFAKYLERLTDRTDPLYSIRKGGEGRRNGKPIERVVAEIVLASAAVIRAAARKRAEEFASIGLVERRKREQGARAFAGRLKGEGIRALARKSQAPATFSDNRERRP